MNNNMKEILKNNQVIFKTLVWLKKVLYSFIQIIICVFCKVENKALFQSFSGKSYSCNPRAISEELHKQCPDLDIVWLFNDPIEKRFVVPNYIRCIDCRSLRAIIERSTARVWVENFPVNATIRKRKEQLYIQTWHGDRGFKKVLYDCWPDGSRPSDLIEDSICNLAVSGSVFGDNAFRSAFRYSGSILRVGSPRNDRLINYDQSIADSIREQVGIPLGTKVLLYAPTYRDKNMTEYQEVNIDLHVILDSLQVKTSCKWICLIRTHVASLGFDVIECDDRWIIDVTNYEDMADLLIVTDFLITDYSSSVCDYVLLKRPYLLWQPDREDYVMNDRNLCFDIKDSPFIVATCMEEAIAYIASYTDEAVKKNCEEVLDFYGTNETGHASEKAVEYILSNIKL